MAPLITDPRKTIYLTTPGTSVGIDHNAFEVRRPESPLLRVPIENVRGIICFGQIQLSTECISRGVESGVDIVWLTRNGKFRARAQGPVNGNVLTRIAQHECAASTERSLMLAISFVGAKILNCRTLLLDAVKDNQRCASRLKVAAAGLAEFANSARLAPSVEVLRGVEGIAAKTYFAAVGALIDGSEFSFSGRAKRPPTDPVNALLSLFYSFVDSMCRGAAEAAGLDPEVGFLHSPMPGRHSLASDLIEELRAPVIDRFVLNLVNRKQVKAKHFESMPGNVVKLKESARSEVLGAWDSWISSTVRHSAFKERIERRQLPHVQALFLARHLRNDLSLYVPFRSVRR